MISCEKASDTIKAHLHLHDAGKTFWIYNEEENIDTFEEKHVLAMRPSISLAKTAYPVLFTWIFYFWSLMHGS